MERMAGPLLKKPAILFPISLFIWDFMMKDGGTEISPLLHFEVEILESFAA